MGYRDGYRKKMNRIGRNHVERTRKRKQRNFEYYFQNTLNRELCLIDENEAQAVFQDHSQSNNKDLSDDKYIIVPNEQEIRVGSYVKWRKKEWLVFTEEAKTIPSHQQLKIKIVNETMLWLDNEGKICNGGKGWGAYVQNQTLYTLGIEKSGHHSYLANAKMMMYMQNNPETARLRKGKRIFIGREVYKICFMDVVSRKGLINYLLEEDTLGANDSAEHAIADYYSDYQPELEPEQEELATITGSDVIKQNQKLTYTVSGYNVQEWVVETIEGEALGVEIHERNEQTISIYAPKDNRYLGKTITIIAHIDNDSYVSKSVRIARQF